MIFGLLYHVVIYIYSHKAISKEKQFKSLPKANNVFEKEVLL
jgi:hypothetical protein